jgi:hypothetical protein
MKNKRCSIHQQINGQWTYQQTMEVVPSSAHRYSLETFKALVVRNFNLENIIRAGHNFYCPLNSPLENNAYFSFVNVNLTEERLFLNLKMTSASKIKIFSILLN